MLKEKEEVEELYKCIVISLSSKEHLYHLFLPLFLLQEEGHWHILISAD